jgi:hypothetical protein
MMDNKTDIKSEDHTRLVVKQLFESGQKEAAYGFYKTSGHACQPIMSFEEFVRRMSDPVAPEIEIIWYFYSMTIITCLTLIFFGCPEFFGTLSEFLK